MSSLKKKFVLLVALALLVSPLTALAGAPGIITFAPGAGGGVPNVGIPTMGAMGLILMSLVLAGIAVQHIRSQGGIGSFFVGLLLVGAIASATGGMKLVQVAKATDYTITDPSGETFEFGFGLHTFTNDSGVAQEVTDLEIRNCEAPSSASRTGGTICEIGTGVADGDSCDLQCGLDR